MTDSTDGPVAMELMVVAVDAEECEVVDMYITMEMSRVELVRSRATA
jgi:hypothetical protein